jgi:acetyltransferase
MKGNIAIITQSGHLGEIISEELTANGIGIRALVGTGNQLDVSVGDVIQHFADDNHTRAISVYLEGVQDGRKFMEEAAYAAKRKPLVVFKVGRTGIGARAALTHTASLVGDYQVYQAAFRQSGIIEARDVQELVDCCVSLSMLPRARGRNLVIITNAGGVGAIAADEAAKSGLEVKPLSEQLKRKLRSEFRDSGFISNAALGNPVDLTASVGTNEFVKATEIVLSSPDYDLALIIPTHQTPTIGSEISAKLTRVVSRTAKPSCMCVMGHAELAARIHGEFMARGIPSFPNPERAVRALSVIPAYEVLREGARAPVSPRRKGPFALSRLRGSLPQPDVSELLRAYGIREPKSIIIRSFLDLKAIGRIGFPVACKLLAEGLLHKTDSGGVLLNIMGMKELTSAFLHFKELTTRKGLHFDGMLVQGMVERGVEVILGGTRDPTFGPTMLFGVGGTYTELVRDYSLAIAPVTPREARTMVASSRLGRVLNGYRGGPKVKLDKLCGIISRFSRIMVENPAVEQIELNPLVATEDEILSVDSKVVLTHDSTARVH